MAHAMRAAGLLGGVPLVALLVTPAAGQAVLPSGIYVGAEAGLGIHAANSISDVFNPADAFCIFCGDKEPLAVGESAVLGGKIGIRMNPILRAEIDVDYLTSANVKTTFPGQPGSASANLTSFAVLFNGYLDFPGLPPGVLGPFCPFAMAGIGFANNDLAGISGTGGTGPYLPVTLSGVSRTDFAYDVGAGLAYPVAPRLTADLQYRYMDLGSLRGAYTIYAPVSQLSPRSPLKTGSIAVHAVTIALRYDL
jgi:opacity protein-like surface antigen